MPTTAVGRHRLADRAPLGRATIGDQLRRHARTQPHKVAFVSYAPERAEITYGELDAAGQPLRAPARCAAAWGAATSSR